MTHSSHADAIAFLNADNLPSLTIAAHSHAEIYVALTKRSGPAPILLDAIVARDALADLARITRVISLSASATVDAVQRFALIGVGARLYDYLIGQTGVLHGAAAIVTFNPGHMRALFPTVAVHTPAEWLTLDVTTLP